MGRLLYGKKVLPISSYIDEYNIYSLLMYII